MLRPADDYDYGEQELVRAKPIDARTARNLGISGGKDFVKGSERSQNEFYGSQQIVSESGGGQCSRSRAGEEGGTSFSRPMTHDERNKISASIIKAEMKRDMDRVRRLKRKLEEGIVEIGKEKEGKNSADAESGEKESGQKEVVLMKMDKISGLVAPARSQQRDPTNAIASRRKGTVDSEYEKKMELSQMVAEEKSTTSEEQITMFNRSAKVCSESKVDDDWVVDDNIMSHPKKRKHERKQEGIKIGQRIKEHKFAEHTLASCSKCIDGLLRGKHAIVATGLKTYLAVVDWDGLSSDHCYIAPMAHYASSVVMDEDVYEEMKLWMKGLVAMWSKDEEEEQDCVFVENAMNVREQQHMFIECIPMPKELGDMAPIYFKKAIMESEKEWSDNKKLIDLSKSSKAGVRGAIPKGFPYFAVNFGLQPGFAHVIEDEKMFPANFAQEIIAGMLDLPHRHWRNPKQQTFDEILKKKRHLQTKWAKYDWTEIVKGELEREEEEEIGKKQETTQE